MSQDLLASLPPTAVDTMEPSPAPGHALGDVLDDWHAVEVWLQAVEMKNKKKVTTTVETYRYHLAKLRWYCENVGRVTPSRWSSQDAKRFCDFLADIPVDAICAHPTVAGVVDDKNYVKEGEPGWTPFRKQPSQNSQSDIKRFVHAMFSAWHKTGYIRIHPMALMGSDSKRSVNTDRAVSLDLYELVLKMIAEDETKTYERRQMQVRDTFVFEALRGLGLRASELVGARMSAFYQVQHPQTRVRYWIFHVSEETGKGGKSRKVPVPPGVWRRFVDYRSAFGLPATPQPGDKTSLLLSPRTRDVNIGTTTIKRTADRRFFKAWGEVGTRHGLYKIVKQRLRTTADALRLHGEVELADQLESASPHWLRHTFGKAKIQEGVGVRSLAGALGHASVNTTMIYTEQDALDLIEAYESASPGCVAREGVV